MAERYFSFRISGQECAIDSDSIIEVVDDILITKIPLSQPFIIGVSNFRGELIASIDLALFLGQEKRTSSEEINIICNSPDGPVAFKVDAIGDILTPDKILTAEEINTEVNLPFFEGVILGEKGLVRVLDIDSILTEINNKQVV